MRKKILILGVVGLGILGISFFQNCSAAVTQGAGATNANGADSTGTGGGVYDGTSPQGIYFFGTVKKFNGNLGGRAGADAKCQEALADFKAQGHPFNCSMQNTHAVLGVNGQDRILDMQQKFSIPQRSLYGIYLPIPQLGYRVLPMNNGQQATWKDLVGTLATGAGPGISLSPLHFFINSDPTGYWMGVKGDTAVTGAPADTCNSFTYDQGFPSTPSGGECAGGTDLRCAEALVCTNGECGLVRGNQWQQCNQQAHLMCACW